MALTEVKKKKNNEIIKKYKLYDTFFLKAVLTGGDRSHTFLG